MRVWDINPGYLNRQSLLGEHRELHGIVSIVVQSKGGYSNHPEVSRWRGYGWALRQRHQLLAAEMSLRGFTDSSPVLTRSNKGKWPETYIDHPFRQFELLESKYTNREQGRIPLPKTAQQLWSHHKYSVLARDINIYREIGHKVSRITIEKEFHDLAMTVTELLRLPPTVGGIRNSLQHMWGHVSDYPYASSNHQVESWSLIKLLEEIRWRALARKDTYLISSTALSELKAWIPKS